MNRRSEPYPPELPMPELLHVDAASLEMVMRFSALYRGRLTDAQATLRKRMLADAAGADAYIATGKTRNGRDHKPSKELNGERLKDARWHVRDWPTWARENVADIVARNAGQSPDPSALVVELAQRSNLNIGILCRFHRNSERFRAAVKEAGGKWPDRIAKRALMSEHGPHIPGTKAIPANVRLRSPEWFTFEQRPIR